MIQRYLILSTNDSDLFYMFKGGIVVCAGFDESNFNKIKYLLNHRDGEIKKLHIHVTTKDDYENASAFYKWYCHEYMKDSSATKIDKMCIHLHRRVYHLYIIDDKGLPKSVIYLEKSHLCRYGGDERYIIIECRCSTYSRKYTKYKVYEYVDNYMRIIKKEMLMVD